jgi:shikimate kinase
LHITLVNFKLRHICVFSIKKLMKSKENLVFLGMMGSGKSSIGSLVAKKLKLDFIDVDKEIEKELGQTISKIFETKGEDYFRKYEEKITLKILKINQIVISLGGGAFVNKVIRKEILKNHTSFWLNWKIETLLNRITNSKKRPIAFNSTENELIDLIKKRSNIYSKALYEIKCDKLSKSEIVRKILDNYETN